MTLARASGLHAACIYLLGCACGAGPGALTWKRQVTTTNADLVAVGCTPWGVYALDVQRERHALHGHGEIPSSAHPDLVARRGDLVYRIRDYRLARSTDGGRTWTPAVLGEPRSAVEYGRAEPRRIAIAADGARVYILGRYTSIGNGLEDSYAYLLRSDDRGRSWAEVWTGPNVGPMGHEQRRVPDAGGALVVLADGALAMNATADGQVLVSRNAGQTFEARGTPQRRWLADLWIGPDGVLRGVGSGGMIVVSRDGARTFTVERSGVTDDLEAITECGGTIWIVGAKGTALTADVPPVRAK